MDTNGWIDKIDNVKCLLEVGEEVIVDPAWGPKLGGKKAKVLEIRRHVYCESGFMVKINIYTLELDSNWLMKITAE